MSLDRVQVVRNFSSIFTVSWALTGSPLTPASKYVQAQIDRLGTNKRVGRLRLLIPAGATVTMTDQDGVTSTITTIAAISTTIVDIPMINGDALLGFSGSGTLVVQVFAD